VAAVVATIAVVRRLMVMGETEAGRPSGRRLSWTLAPPAGGTSRCASPSPALGLALAALSGVRRPRRDRPTGTHVGRPLRTAVRKVGLLIDQGLLHFVARRTARALLMRVAAVSSQESGTEDLGAIVSER